MEEKPKSDEALNSYMREQLRYIENAREKERPNSDTIDTQLYFRAINR